jgi:ketosteroid isomerase-like protein
MNSTQLESKAQILECERILLEAFKNKDLQALGDLLHDNCLFILPNAKTVTKSMVIENYRVGDMVMTSLVSNDHMINFIDDTAIVSLDLELKGKYFDQSVETNCRYLRVWKLFNNTWKVIAVAGIQINK